MEATGGDMMGKATTEKKRSKSLKRKVHPALGSIGNKKKRSGKSLEPKRVLG
jgi:hypothetical protein